VHLDVPRGALLIVVDMLYDGRLARLYDNSHRTGMVSGIAGRVTTVGQGVARGATAPMRLPGGPIGQADAMVSHIDHIERVRQRIQNGLEQAIVLENDVVTVW